MKSCIHGFSYSVQNDFYRVQEQIYGIENKHNTSTFKVQIPQFTDKTATLNMK